MKKPTILDCTLRDGSYAIDFQFTASDTQKIVQALEQAGIDLIEVGHGLGLGASNNGKGVAAESDVAYLQATAEAADSARWGMFCIPGIATLEDIDMAAEYGMKFIRIGTGVEDYAKAQAFIERAKHHGMLVCANFMKSYVAPPETFANSALEASKYGVDVVYIVDSAGGMLPNDIKRYVDATRTKCADIQLGFHGHNNIGMGVANGLMATELGIDIIDTSLQGLGRGAGNVPTGQFICALLRQGIDLGIDPIDILDFGEKHIMPLIQTAGFTSINVISGLALFHSSYTPLIKRYAKQYNVDPRRLILAVNEVDRSSTPEALVAVQARRLSQEKSQATNKSSETRLSYSQMLLKLFQTHTDKVALVDGDTSYTYAELYQMAARFVTKCQGQDLESGARIAVCLPNGAEFVTCYLGCLLGGYTVVPINPQLPESDKQRLVETTQAQLFITKPEEIQHTTANEPFIAAIHDENILAILHSSGTTGTPKGICHTVGGMLGCAQAFNKRVGIDANIRLHHALPMSYTAGFLNSILSPLMAGGTIILAPQFNAISALDFWNHVKKHQSNVLWLTPMMIAFLTQANRDSDVASWLTTQISFAFVGTAPLLQVSKNEFEEKFGITCFNSYGITEGLFVSCNSPQHNKENSVGRILSHIEVQARDENGNTLKSGQTGELFVKTPFALKGYLNPESNSFFTPLTNDGWLPTGDQGYIDEDNYLFINGRIKDIIIRGGVNINPADVENTLMGHPDVHEAVVMGKPHPFWGEEVIAYLTTRDNKVIDAATLKAYCQQHLMADAVPSKYVFIDEFSRTASGKIQKTPLLEQA